MDLEQKYDAMSVYERENADLYYQSWVEQFEQAKASGDDMNVIQLIYSTKEPYCLWKILQYLKPIAELALERLSCEDQCQCVQASYCRSFR